MVSLPLKWLAVIRFGARPEALIPCNLPSAQISAKASPPMPFMHGSTTVSVIAVASAASTALPPRRYMARPAAEASGCEVETTLAASSGMRCEV